MNVGNKPQVCSRSKRCSPAPYLQENALKIGDDQYYSHGFNHNPYTRATFEAEYRQVHTPGDVFVQAVEYVTYPDPP